MTDLKWEKFTATKEIEAVQVTEDNILDLARELFGVVKFDGDDLVFESEFGAKTTLGGYVDHSGEPLGSQWSKVEPEPEYKEGERVEVHGWSSPWNGPATVLAQPTDTYPYYRIRTDGGREGGFTEAYLRPLEVFDA